MHLNKIAGILFLSILLLSGCIKPLPEIEGHMPLADIVKKGFARDKKFMLRQEGREIRIWGYVDHANISLKQGTIEKQPLNWDTPGNDEVSYFDLKARQTDGPGESIRIRIAGDPGPYKDLFNKLRDMETSDRQAWVLVTGIVRTFEAPTNTGLLIGVSIDVTSPENVSFKWCR